MRLIGLDFGEKTIGVAVSDPRGRVASGLTTLRRPAPEVLRANMRELKRLARDCGAVGFVLGFPKNMDGTPSARCALTLRFKARLERYFKRLPVTLWDERLSTRAVERVYSGPRVDEMAAAYILQGFLDFTNKQLASEPGAGNKPIPEDGMENEKGETLVTLIDEAGNETEFNILAAHDQNGVVYWLLAEADDREEAEVFHYKCIVSDDEEMMFELIDDGHEEFDDMLTLFKEDYAALGIETE